MTTNYFCSPELSQRLIELGVVGQFAHIHWLKNGDIGYSWTSLGEVTTGIQAIHFSDLLLPGVVDKLFPKRKGWLYGWFSRQLTIEILAGDDWQTYLTEQLNMKSK